MLAKFHKKPTLFKLKPKNSTELHKALHEVHKFQLKHNAVLIILMPFHNSLLFFAQMEFFAVLLHTKKNNLKLSRNVNLIYDNKKKKFSLCISHSQDCLQCSALRFHFMLNKFFFCTPIPKFFISH